jgi:3-hydroxy-9,10-secoandrosta-1,3,5(10)-triene-9,17-dione monooxygenase reductase component
VPDDLSAQPAELDAELDVEIDPKEFRTVLGHFPTGVTVVAGVHDGRARGLAVGSFFSVSLDPPLVGFCVGCRSSSWSPIEQSGAFAVSVLSEHQAEVSTVFSSKAEDKFATVDWVPAPVTGSPYLREAVAHIDCHIEAIHEGGDHLIVIGRVRALDVHRAEHGPLLFFKGGYGRHQPI